MADLISRQAAIDALSCENPTEIYIYYDDAVKAIQEVPSAQPETHEKSTETHSCDYISRKDAIYAILHNQEVYSHNFGDDPIDKYTIAIIDNDAQTIAQLPSAQPTLYGYQIEHLALIARVMEKEGVTPEKAVQIFRDMKRIIEMLIDEIQEKVERAKMEVEHERTD